MFASRCLSGLIALGMTLPLAAEEPPSTRQIVRLGEGGMLAPPWVERLEFSPNGQQLLTWVGYPADRLLIWDVNTSKLIRSVEFGDYYISPVNWRADGSGLVVLWRSDRNGQTSKHIVWEFTDETYQPPTLDIPERAAEAGSDDLPPRVEVFWSFVFAPDGATLAALHRGGENPEPTIGFWEVQATELIEELKHLRSIPLPQPTPASIQYTSDGKGLVVFGKPQADETRTVTVWDLEEEREVESMTHLHPAGSVSQLSPDFQWLAIGGRDGIVRLIEAKTGEEKARFGPIGPVDQTTGKGSVTNLAFTPDGRSLIASGMSETVFVWDIASGEQIAQLTGHKNFVMTLATSPDSLFVATVGSNQLIRLWDAKSWEPLREPISHTDSVWAGEFSPTGKQR